MSNKESQGSYILTEKPGLLWNHRTVEGCGSQRCTNTDHVPASLTGRKLHYCFVFPEISTLAFSTSSLWMWCLSLFPRGKGAHALPMCSIFLIKGFLFFLSLFSLVFFLHPNAIVNALVLEGAYFWNRHGPSHCFDP